jgi:hypothetical protein
MCLGYEDLNDHDHLRADPALAVMVGKADPKGEDRFESQNRGKALAGKSTLNRLELTKTTTERYKKIVMNPEAIDRMMVEQFLDAHPKAEKQIILDMDATDDPIHGSGRAVLSWLLRWLLLFTAVYLLWRVPAEREAKNFRYRSGQRGIGGCETGGCTNPTAMAEGAHSGARRFRILPG